MTEYALLINGSFKEIRDYGAKPVDIPHKAVTWHDVAREYGAPFVGLENGNWVIRKVDPATLPPPVPQEITFAQLVIGLVTEGWITEQEGDGWLDGVLPGRVNTMIAQLPQQQRFAARARAKRPSAVLRNNSLVLGLAAMEGKTEQQLDQFFTLYATV